MYNVFRCTKADAGEKQLITNSVWMKPTDEGDVGQGSRDFPRHKDESLDKEISSFVRVHVALRNVRCGTDPRYAKQLQSICKQRQGSDSSGDFLWLREKRPNNTSLFTKVHRTINVSDNNDRKNVLLTLGRFF